MTRLFRVLTYDQTGFPFAGASAILRKRALPKWMRWVSTFASVLLFGSILILILPHAGDTPGVDRMMGISILASLAMLSFLGRKSAKLGYRSIASAPYRSGERTLEMDDAGMTVTSDNARWHYPWDHIFDVIAGPDQAAMVLLGPFEYEPIPASAFSDGDEHAAFLSTAQIQVARSRATKP